MSMWTWPAWIGIGGGVLVFALIFLPIVAWQVRHYGQLSARRLLGAAALSVYGVALVAYTLLPLPAGDLTAWCAAHGYDGANLQPGSIFGDIARDTSGMSWPARLRSFSVLQGVFNVVLFVPWGVLARRYFGWSLPASTLSALGLSVLIEATQYTGVYGLIGCSYRYADVDDLLTNTLGGLIGALLAPVLLRWMPSARSLTDARDTARPVTIWRRWLGMLLDAAAFTALGVVLELGFVVGWYVLTGDPVGAPSGARFALGAAVPFVVVFGWPLLTASGASWGQRASWLTPARDGVALLSPARRLLRAAGGGAVWGLLSVGESGARALGATSAATALSSLAGVVAFVIVVAALITRDRRGLSGVLAGTRVVDARALT